MTLEAETLALVTGEILPETLCEVETVVLTNTEGLTDLLVEALRRKDENQSFS